jgi:hypothetical protein
MEFSFLSWRPQTCKNSCYFEVTNLPNEKAVRNGGCLAELKEIAKGFSQHYAPSVRGIIIMTIAAGPFLWEQRDAGGSSALIYALPPFVSDAHT